MRRPDCVRSVGGASRLLLIATVLLALAQAATVDHITLPLIPSLESAEREFQVHFLVRNSLPAT